MYSVHASYHTLMLYEAEIERRSNSGKLESQEKAAEPPKVMEESSFEHDTAPAASI